MAADTAEHAPPGLFRLPLEIMEAVALALPQEDLPSLRLVCREIESKTLRIYTNAFFTNKSFSPALRLSMEYFKSILKDPHFGKALERVTFVLQGVQPSQLDSAWSSLAKKMESGAAAMSKDQKYAYINLRRAYFDMSDTSVSGVERDHPFREGIEMIAKLKQHGFALEISWSNTNTSYQPRQVKVLEQALERYLQLTPIDHPSALAETILRYVIYYRCALKELRMPDPIRLERLSVFTSLDTIEPIHETYSSFSAIHTLEINVTVSWGYRSGGVKGAKSLFSALSNVQHLKLLVTYDTDGFGRPDEWHSTGLARALTTLFMPKLQSANFNIIFPFRDELKRYIQRHIQTLKKLHLKRDWVKNGGANGLEPELQEFAVKAGVENLKIEIK